MQPSALDIPTCMRRSRPCHRVVVDEAVGIGRQYGWPSHVARGAISLAAGAGLAYLLLVSLFIAVIKCDDNCGGADADHWRWTAQFVLAAVGSVLGVAALVLGFTSKTRA